MTRAEFVARLPRKVTAACALITNASGQVLLVKPTYKAGWEVPGGCVEDGESARAACGREVAEELGVQLAIGRLLVVEHQTAPDDTGDSIMFVYEGGIHDEVVCVALPADELEQAQFVPPDVLHEFVPVRLSRRLTAAIRARHEGGVIELVDGVDAAGGPLDAGAGER
ncbi:MAG: hypothetical protein QOI54_1294 [Actinomycetota bacterium]|nr:hypothetical protein [Actinomycetota bacterium]